MQSTETPLFPVSQTGIDFVRLYEIAGFWLISRRQVVKIKRRFGMSLGSHCQGWKRMAGTKVTHAWEESSCLEIWAHQSGDCRESV